MGLLDDAIREHLDLKRRRGADPTEIERAERDALGPVRRGPEGSEEGDLERSALPDDDLGYEEDAADEDHAFEEPNGLAEPREFGDSVASEPSTPPPPAAEYTLDQETEVWDSLEPDAPPLVDARHGEDARHPADFPQEPRDPLEEEPIAQAPPEPYPTPAPPVVDPHATQPHTTDPPAPAPPPRDPGPAEPHEDALGSDTAEYDMELEELEGEDVLEETPEFLQDTPDHDRLWFEQRPPKDFDFDD